MGGDLLDLPHNAVSSLYFLAASLLLSVQWFLIYS